jgi:ADP-ribosyl-[dinitrogen reductase] hydrolase
MLTASKAIGMLAGLSVGDALGAPLEFTPSREPKNYITKYVTGGAHDMQVGEWTDDTAMAMAMADAIIEYNGFNPHQTMTNFVKWYMHGDYIPRGRCFDIGQTTQRALEGFIADQTRPYQGQSDDKSSGNGALMRMAPVIIAAPDKTTAITWATQQTLLTHGSETAVRFSKIFAEELWHADALARYDTYRHDVDIDRNDVLSGGYVPETYRCAMWAFQTTDNFEDCVIKAVNRGHDSDTCGAVAGMIAGAHYGIGGIPDHLYDNLMWKERITDTAYLLWNIRGDSKWK